LVRPLYRSRQVLHALRPRIDDAEMKVPSQTLTDGEARIFFAMEPSDQRHALAVARQVRAQTSDREIIAAALLHDCGKGAVPIWLRILNVLVPGLVRRLGKTDASGWRSAAYRLAHHPELSARMAAAAGSTPTTIRLIRGHIEPDEEWMHLLLRAADDAS
jgi:hypothetical protein